MRKWIPPLLIVVATIASVIVYPDMAERVPTHWNMEGEVDGWSSRFFGAWLMPLMTLAFMLGLHLMVLASATGAQFPVGRILPGAVGVFFIMMGYLLPRAHPNWFIASGRRGR